MDPAQHRAAIDREGAALAAIPASGLGEPVRSCPGWDVAKLIRHTGRVHRWAAEHIAGAESPSGGPRPPEGEALLPWYAESLALLTAELDRHDPSEPASTFAGPGDVAFWLRRQAHEIVVHRWDAEDAVTPDGATPIAAPLAADGIDEWFTLWIHRSTVVKGDGVPADMVGASLHVHCTDDIGGEGGEWILRLAADGPEVERAHAKGDAALRGPANDLLLALWHRIPLTAVDVVGDADQAERVLDLVHIT